MFETGQEVLPVFRCVNNYDTSARSVVDFLSANQNVRDPYSIDWVKAKRMLKKHEAKDCYI